MKKENPNGKKKPSRISKKIHKLQKRSDNKRLKKAKYTPSNPSPRVNRFKVNQPLGASPNDSSRRASTQSKAGNKKIKTYRKLQIGRNHIKGCR